MIFCARGLAEGASSARNAAFWSYFGFLRIRDVLGGLVDVAWAITGPWKQWGLAKHIAKPSKLQKIKIPSPRPPFGELENLSLFPTFSLSIIVKFQIDLTRLIFTSHANPFGF